MSPAFSQFSHRQPWKCEPLSIRWSYSLQYCAVRSHRTLRFSPPLRCLSRSFDSAIQIRSGGHWPFSCCADQASWLTFYYPRQCCIHLSYSRSVRRSSWLLIPRALLSVCQRLPWKALGPPLRDQLTPRPRYHLLSSLVLFSLLLHSRLLEFKRQ